MGKNIAVILVTLAVLVSVAAGGVLLLVKYGAMQKQSPAEEAKQKAAEGVEALQAKDYDRAIKCFTVAIKFNPSDAVMLHNRGLAYFGKHDYEKAVTDYNFAIRYKSDEPEYFTHRGEAELALEKLDDALTDFNRALKLDETYISAYRGRGGVYLAKKEYQKAIAEYSEALQRDAKQASSYDDRAAAYRKLGESYLLLRALNFNYALRDLDAALKVDANYANSYYQRGLIYTKQNQLDKALADFDSKIRLAPDADAYYARGTTNVLKGNADNAQADFDDALKRNSHHFDALMARARLLTAKKAFAKAIADYDAAQVVDGTDEAIYYHRGLAYLAVGEDDRALGDFATLLDKNAQRADAHDLRSQIYLTIRRNTGEALKEANLALDLEPENVVYLTHRAAVYIRRQEYDKALEDLDDALEIDPENLQAINTRGALHFDQKKYDEAIVDYNEAIKLNAKDAPSYNNRGRTYYKKRMYEEARADFLEAIKWDPSFAEAHSNYAWVVAACPDKKWGLNEQIKYNRVAMTHAQEAVKLDSGKTPRYLSAVGVVYSVQKDWDKAIEYENRALAVKNGYDSVEKDAAEKRLAQYVKREYYSEVLNPDSTDP